jgi:hypothetical protein
MLAERERESYHFEMSEEMSCSMSIESYTLSEV